MNRFIIDHHPDAIAKQLCDKHVIKMILEEAQMLCTAIRVHAPEFAEEAGLYKTAHLNHPCSIWVRETKPNYRFGVRLMVAMNEEYIYRYPFKRKDGKLTDEPNTGHKSMRLLDALVEAEKYIPDETNFMTPHPQCFSKHDYCKTNENWPVFAYRNFYWVDKSSFARYTNRPIPHWMEQGDKLFASYNEEAKEKLNMKDLLSGLETWKEKKYG